MSYKITLPICSLVFLFLFCAFTYGAVELFIWPQVADKNIPFISSVWHSVHDILVSIVNIDNLPLFIISALLSVFVLPCVLAIVIFAIVMIAYKPRSGVDRISLSDENVAKSMYYGILNHTSYRKWLDAKYILPCSVVYTLLATALTVLITIESLKGEETKTETAKTVMIFVAIAVIIVAAGLLLSLFASLMFCTLWLCGRISTSSKNHILLNACKEYWQTTDPEEIERLNEYKKREEEARIKRLKEQKEQEERNRQSYSGGYSSGYSGGYSSSYGSDRSLSDSELRDLNQSITHGLWNPSAIDSRTDLTDSQKEQLKSYNRIHGD